MLMEYLVALCLGSRIGRFERMGNYYACFKKLLFLRRELGT